MVSFIDLEILDTALEECIMLNVALRISLG